MRSKHTWVHFKDLLDFNSCLESATLHTDGNERLLLFLYAVLKCSEWSKTKLTGCWLLFQTYLRTFWCFKKFEFSFFAFQLQASILVPQCFLCCVCFKHYTIKVETQNVLQRYCAKKKCRNQITKKGSINFIAGVIDAEHVSLQRDWELCMSLKRCYSTVLYSGLVSSWCLKKSLNAGNNHSFWGCKVVTVVKFNMWLAGLLGCIDMWCLRVVRLVI